jgi:predicted enzyme related to lactoylglutathione lyase
MGDRESYAPGTFCWADLGTTDAASARDFYTRLFGWEAVDTPAADEGVYTMFKLDGRDVAAMYEMGEEERQKLPAHWSSYVSVEDADAATARARELGAEVVAEPVDVTEAGRMAVLRDPVGARVHLWQPRSQAGAGRVNDPGCMVWNELASPDPGRAGSFYGELFGWTTDTDETGYAIVQRDGERNGGIRPTQDDEPPHWLVYFTAASCDEATTTVREAGGQVMAGPIDVTVGRIAIVADPQGAVFALFEGEVDP